MAQIQKQKTDKTGYGVRAAFHLHTTSSCVTAYANLLTLNQHIDVMFDAAKRGKKVKTGEVKAQRMRLFK